MTEARELTPEQIAEEYWLPVVGYEGLYEVSNTGKVRSLDRHVLHKGKKRFCKGREIATPVRVCGYPVANLWKDGKMKNIRVHRIVAKAFLDNKENHPAINHKDKNRTNNNVSNLEWCTHAYNTEYSHAKLYYFISPDGNECEIYNLKKFCTENGLNQGNMWLVHSGVKKRYKGWKRWK